MNEAYLGPSVYPLKGTGDRFYFTYWEYLRHGGGVMRDKRQQKRCPGHINSRRRAEQYADAFARRKYDEARDSRFKQQYPPFGSMWRPGTSLNGTDATGSPRRTRWMRMVNTSPSPRLRPGWDSSIITFFHDGVTK